MKYYSIQTDENNIGRVLHDGKVGDLLDSKNLYEKFESNEIRDIIPDDNFKHTDILESGDLSLKGLVISQKFHDLIKDFKLLDIQFIEIKNKELNGYKFMFFNSDLTDKIDYEKSKFRLYELDIIDMEFEELDIKIPENRKSVIKTDIDIVSVDIDKRIYPSQGYKFKEVFKIEELDIFRIGHYDLNFYISEKVKVTLENNGISGCKFIEQKMLTTE
ncbi:hypothetical protein [Winogradskyella forsetii]|uniref:hypothetical protein n=1 Tax=Winogradskyella forsetii TaxID=2686077 RepID=UPI0015B8B691|nr:hypothetical protein [Winogradskyella forsetii]